MYECFVYVYFYVPQASVVLMEAKKSVWILWN